jgi:dTMP kinase
LFERAPDAVLAATTGLADDESFNLRRKGGATLPGVALRSLGLALNTEAGWQLWQELSKHATVEALACLNGVGDERAWQLREQSFAQNPGLRELAVGTLSGLDDERAWRMREELLAARAAALDASYDLARAIAKSVTGLGSERAWQLRQRARKLAPVAALSSLAGLSDDASWQWRSESLRKAPKVVMSTLKGRFEAAAWRMRREVVLDCKEALDGLQGVPNDEAWGLRDGSSDVWPSTVVKTLAGLADEVRGQELVQRQLHAYPENVSLLKHVASIALGLHRLRAASV